MLAKEFIEKHNLSLTASRASANPHMIDQSKGMFHWDCRVTDGKKGFDLIFSMGSANRGLKKKRHDPNDPSKVITEWKRISDSEFRKMNNFWQNQVQPIPPQLDEVLECLASDFLSVNNNPLAFELWAEEMGYDPDSRKAEKTYNHIRQQAHEFITAFGYAIFNELLSVRED